MEMANKLNNHGFVNGEVVTYLGKRYIIEEETPNYIYAIGSDGEKYRIWSKQLVQRGAK